MRRPLFLTALGVGLCLAGVASAQPRPGAGRTGPNMQKLEAQLDRMETKLKELEEKIARMQSSPKPDQGKGPMSMGGRGFGPPGPGGFGPRGGMGFSRRGPGGFGPRGPFGFGPGGPATGDAESRPADHAKSAKPAVADGKDFERRLDRIIDELQKLRKDVQEHDRKR